MSLSIEQVAFLCLYSFSSILSTFRASLNILLRWIELHLSREWMEIKLLHNAWAALPTTWQSGKCCISNHITFLKVRRCSQSEKRKWEKGEEEERRREGGSRVSHIGSKIIDALRKQATTSPLPLVVWVPCCCWSHCAHCKSQSREECLAGSLGNATSGPTAVTACGLEFCHRGFNGKELAEGDMLFT